jgi:hypothetical protein
MNAKKGCNDCAAILIADSDGRFPRLLLEDSSNLSSDKEEAGHVGDGVAMELVTRCPHSVQCRDPCSY